MDLSRSIFLAHKVGDPEDQYACKQVNKHLIEKNKKELEFFRTEVKYMKGLNHPNILKCYDFLESGENYYLILNLCKDGNLHNYIDSQPNKRVDEPQAIFFLQQIMNGFKELGKNKIIHHHFEPGCVFLNDDNLVIGDIGMYKIWCQYELTKCHNGTPQTMAPEILFTDQNFEYTNQADLWSIGITFYMMLYGTDGPFSDAFNMYELINQIRKHSGENVIFPSNVEVTEETKNLIRSLLTINPDDRIDWKDFFGHTIFKSRRESPENLNKMLESKKTRYMAVYKEFDENTEYVKNNPDFTFAGKTPPEWMKDVHKKKEGQQTRKQQQLAAIKESDKPKKTESNKVESKKVEDKSCYCAVF